MLEDGFNCRLLNPQHLRNVPGRKTDVKDAARDLVASRGARTVRAARDKGRPKTAGRGAAGRVPLVVRTTPHQEAQLARVRKRRGFPTQQQAASTALTAGLRTLALEDAVGLYRNGRSLEEASREVGLPVSEVFEHFHRERIPLIENEDALDSLARLSRRYELPSLERAVALIQQDLLARPA